MLQLSIIRNIDARVLDEIGSFRYGIWAAEGDFTDPAIVASGKWIDAVDLAPSTVHWVIRDGVRIIAAARLSLHMCLEDMPHSAIFLKALKNDEKPVAALNRLVVDPDYRRRGLGRFLDAQRIGLSCALGAKVVTVEAVGERRCFQLIKQGFEVKSVYAQDSDFHFHTPQSYYALVGKSDAFVCEALTEAGRALGVEVRENEMTPSERGGMSTWAKVANFP